MVAIHVIEHERHQASRYTTAIITLLTLAGSRPLHLSLALPMFWLLVPRHAADTMTSNVTSGSFYWSGRARTRPGSHKSPTQSLYKVWWDEDEISRENNCGRQSLFCQIAFILNSGPLHCDSFMCFLLTVQRPHATVPQRRKARKTDSLHDCDRQRWDVINVMAVIYVQVKCKWLQLTYYTPATPDQQHWPVRATIRGGVTLGWRRGDRCFNHAIRRAATTVCTCRSNV